MSHVFISYAREDRPAASFVRLALRARGFTVWWDNDIHAADPWEERIYKALTSADAVVVLWSARSVKSDWVRHEASAARLRGIDIPIQLDATALPTIFAGVQAQSLSDWQQRDDLPRSVSRAVSRKIRRRIYSMLLRQITTAVAMVALVASAIALYNTEAIKSSLSTFSGTNVTPPHHERMPLRVTSSGSLQVPSHDTPQGQLTLPVDANGRPLILMLVPGDPDSQSSVYLQCDEGGNDAECIFLRDGQAIATISLRLGVSFPSGNGTYYSGIPASLFALDTEPGNNTSHVYSVQLKTTTSGKAQINNVRLAAFEI